MKGHYIILSIMLFKTFSIIITIKTLIDDFDNTRQQIENMPLNVLFSGATLQFLMNSCNR